MDLITIIADVKMAIGVAQSLYELGKDAAPAIKRAVDIINGKHLTPAERAEMVAEETALRNRLNAPLEDDPPA